MELVMKKRNLFFKMALVMIITVFGIISCDFLANKTFYDYKGIEQEISD